ncbi:hypothetical protein JCM6882_008336 [Rhodosporidiobolus microsporus]
MDKLVQRFSKSPAASTSTAFAQGGQEGEEYGYALPLGRGIERCPMPEFAMPMTADPTNFLQLHTDDASDPDCRIKIKHGTTTLAFKYKGGIVVAVDSRATAGSYIASGTVKKVIEINPYLLGTMAGGAADCQYWETYLGIQCRLHELRNHERISVAAASKYLSNLVYSYKGMGLSMGTMVCGYDKTGGNIFYVDSDGTRLKGDLFSVGSGSTFAYGVLDAGYKWDLTEDEAIELGSRAIAAAQHRDAFSGNTQNIFHFKADGPGTWDFIGNFDFNDLWYGEKHYARPKYDLLAEQKVQQEQQGAPVAASA